VATSEAFTLGYAMLKKKTPKQGAVEYAANLMRSQHGRPNTSRRKTSRRGVGESNVEARSIKSQANGGSDIEETKTQRKCKSNEEEPAMPLK